MQWITLIVTLWFPLSKWLGGILCFLSQLRGYSLNQNVHGDYRTGLETKIPTEEFPNKRDDVTIVLCTCQREGPGSNLRRVRVSPESGCSLSSSVCPEEDMDSTLKYFTISFLQILKRSECLSHYHIRRCIQKFPDWVDNEINNNNKHSLRSNTKGYGGKTH
jgi:hypothetical protein